jgi:ATP-dependent DNA ligase
MKALPTLYKRTSTGKIQQWTIHVDKSKYWVESGQVDGKLKKNRPTVAKPKNVGKSNETTPEEQAQLEAQAKWDLKKRKDYFEKIEEIDNIEFKPTLAHNSEKHVHKLIGKKVMASPKLDGVRCRIVKDGAFSRTGKKFVATKFIEEDLKEFFEKNPDAYLDGELYNHKYKDNFNEIISLCRRMKNFTEDHWTQIKEDLEFHVFDFPKLPPLDFNEAASTRYWEGYTSLFMDEDRNEIKYDRLKLVKQVFIEDFDPENPLFQEFYSTCLEAGYEGAMIKEASSPYEMKRSYKIQKFKKFETEDFEIVDVIEGKGNRAGMFGYFVLKLPNGNTFNANSRGDEEYYKEILANKEDYKGKLATHRFMNYTPDGVPRGGAVIAIRDYE